MQFFLYNICGFNTTYRSVRSFTLFFRYVILYYFLVPPCMWNCVCIDFCRTRYPYFFASFPDNSQLCANNISVSIGLLCNPYVALHILLFNVDRHLSSMFVR